MMKDIRRIKFYQQKGRAKERGISFDLTFEEWWGIWQKSGRWEERGCRKGQYVMARNGDIGSYAIGNVSIIKHEENSRGRSPEGKARVIASNRTREITYWVGLRSPNAIFTDDQIREMRRLFATGEWSQTAIGKKFGVSRSCVGRAVARETYADVK